MLARVADFALVFTKGIFFLFEPHGWLLRIGSEHHYGPLWMPVPLVAFTGELHGVDNGVSQLARGFIRGHASAMRGGVHVCLTVWTWFLIGSSLGSPFYRTTASIIYVISLFIFFK